MPVVLHGPAKHLGYGLALRQADQGAMPARDEHRQVVRIAVQGVGDVGEFARLQELGQVAAVQLRDLRLLCRHGPHFELDGVAGQRGHLQAKTGLVQVVHGHQGLDRMVARGEQLAGIRGQVALVRRDHEHLAAALVGVGVLGTVYRRRRAGELAQRVGGGKVGVEFRRVGTGLLAEIIRHAVCSWSWVKPKPMVEVRPDLQVRGNPSICGTAMSLGQGRARLQRVSNRAMSNARPAKPAPLERSLPGIVWPGGSKAQLLHCAGDAGRSFCIA